MPRTYIKKIGGRTYQNYTPETLQRAVEEIRNKQLSFRAASQKYNIHRNTLFNKVREKNSLAPGRPTVFTEAEENGFVSHIIAMSSFGFPVTPTDLRCIVRAYLNKIGKRIPQFKDNMPGPDWARGFINRHKHILSHRFAKNIKNARAAINEEVINTFFNHINKELEGVPPSNIWNYDETNLVDDPGSKKVLVKRGTKYPEIIRNSTKACTSIMVCGNADGDTAPVYVNYKSQKLWQTWIEGGPEGARYNCSKSGWFDSHSFEDWFINTMLPILKKQDGKKVLIGDNLSSHHNKEVIKRCEEHTIAFICLPPNATHLLQPLDVAYFRPMKVHWRKILSEWKETAYGSRCATIPKDTFPGLIKKLFEALKTSQKENLKAGFRKCGIAPINRDVVIARLPKNVLETDLEQVGAVSDSFIDFLKTTRDTQTIVNPRRKRKAVNVVPGKSVCMTDITDVAPSPPLRVALTKKKKKDSSKAAGKRKKQTNDRNSISTSEESDDNYSLRESSCSPYNVEEDETMIPSTSGLSLSKRATVTNDDSSSEESDRSCSLLYPQRNFEGSTNMIYNQEDDSKDQEVENVSPNKPILLSGQQPETLSTNDKSIQSYNQADYVIVNYDDKYYPGTITSVDGDIFLISTMVKGNKFWKWPEKKDEIWYERQMLKEKINAPRKVTKRGHYDVPEIWRYL